MLIAGAPVQPVADTITPPNIGTRQSRHRLIPIDDRRLIAKSGHKLIRARRPVREERADGAPPTGCRSGEAAIVRREVRFAPCSR